MEAFGSSFIFRDFGESGRGEGWFHWGRTMFRQKPEGSHQGNGQTWDVKRTSQVVLVIKNPPANAGDIREVSLIPGWGRPPGEGHGSPLQHSCLENPMDRGAWWAMVPRVSKSLTQLTWLSTHEMRESSESSRVETRRSRAFCREDQWHSAWTVESTVKWRLFS